MTLSTWYFTSEITVCRLLVSLVIHICVVGLRILAVPLILLVTVMLRGMVLCFQQFEIFFYWFPGVDGLDLVRRSMLHSSISACQ